MEKAEMAPHSFIGLFEAKEAAPFSMMQLPGLGHVHGQEEPIFGVNVDAGQVYRDDLTGQILDPELVRIARQKELDFFEAKGVWLKKSIMEARQRTGKMPAHNRPLGRRQQGR